MNPITLAIDAMGGDDGASVVVPATIRVAKERPEVSFILVGLEHDIQQLLRKHGGDSLTNISIKHASEVVEMHESPTNALRSKKDSSMRVALDCVKHRQASACVSAGNTGALMVTARFVLKTLAGIDRPAITTRFPTMKEGHYSLVLDLGANVNSSSEHLVQFAVMGSVLASEVLQIENPSVALLNVGEEEIKGNDLVKATSNELSQIKALNYTGYVEGDDIYKGTADVIVCDGFVGNVALKASEGIAHLIFEYIRQTFTHNFMSKCVALIARRALKRMKKRIDPAEYNGAILAGLQGVVVKSHGGANEKAFANALRTGVRLAEKNVPEKIRARVEQVLDARQANDVF